MRYQISTSALNEAKSHLQALMTDTSAIERREFNFPCCTKIVSMHMAENDINTMNCGDEVDFDSIQLCQSCYAVYLGILAGDYDINHAELDTCSTATCWHRIVNFITTNPKLMAGLGIALGLTVLAGLSVYASLRSDNASKPNEKNSNSTLINDANTNETATELTENQVAQNPVKSSALISNISETFVPASANMTTQTVSQINTTELTTNSTLASTSSGSNTSKALNMTTPTTTSSIAKKSTTSVKFSSDD